MAEPQHFSIVVLDVERSGALSGPEKAKVRADLYAMLDGALSRSEIGSSSTRREDRGDGIYLLIDAAVSKRRLFDPFTDALDEMLRQRAVGDIALRLRLVIHQGEASLDSMGSSGPAVDEAFAMLDAKEVKEALASTRRGRMAVVVPDDLYRSVVVGYLKPDPNLFRMRRLETKRGQIKAWITVMGASEQPGSGPREPAAPPKTETAPVMTVQQGDIKVRKSSGFVGNNLGNVSIGRRISGPGKN